MDFQGLMLPYLLMGVPPSQPIYCPYWNVTFQPFLASSVHSLWLQIALKDIKSNW